jgi:hypothetical protein
MSVKHQMVLMYFVYISLLAFCRECHNFKVYNLQLLVS